MTSANEDDHGSPHDGGSAVHRLTRQICKARHALAAELLGEVGVHGGPARILNVLWQQDGLTLSELAARLEVQPPTITRMVQRMEASGLIERTPCREDQRVTHVYATARGRALKPAVEAVWATLDARLVEGMSDVEHRRLHDLLERVRDNLTRRGGAPR